MQQQEQQQRVVPGTRLGSSDEYEAGKGTYVRNEHIYASLTGTAFVQKDDTSNKPSILVQDSKQNSVILPQIGSTVLARIVKLTLTFAKAEIICLQQGQEETESFQLLHTPYPAMLRTQDIRQTDVDKIKMMECFRPGDLIRAQVLSLGYVKNNIQLTHFHSDAKSYYLSTAKNELGVVFARCASSGYTMVPLSWNEMQCSITGIKEARKVAKVNLL